MTSIIIIDKTGTLKTLNVKDYKEEDLYKKCGFKKPDNFTKQTEWSIKLEGQKYSVAVYAKTEGKANMENKYDFPPPIDSTLFFGSCAVVGQIKGANNKYTLFSLTIPIWNKIYEKLFGGFEDLAATAAEDEFETDELDDVPSNKKTKNGGYLKDGFVVDDDVDDDEDASDYDSEGTVSDDSDGDDDIGGGDGDLEVEDIGSELSEEEYDYTGESQV